MLLGKNAGTATTDEAQVLMAYEHMEGQLRRDLSRPNEHTTVESLIEELNTLKHIWFDIYSNNYTGQNQRPANNRQEPDLYGRQRQSTARPQRVGPPAGVSYRRNEYPTSSYYSNYPYRPSIPNSTFRYANRTWQGSYQPSRPNRYPNMNQNYANPSRIDNTNRCPLQITAGDPKNLMNSLTIANPSNGANRTNNQQNRPWLNRPYNQ